MTQKIEDMIEEHYDIVSALGGDVKNNISLAVDRVYYALANGYKMLVFGNGGSAADAQHIAGELVGRFKLERKALPVIALTTDSSVLTAWGNDYSFDTIFERQVEALAENGDVLMGISTSGNSENVLKAINKGRTIGTYTITLTGRDGGKLKSLSDLNINIPSHNTPRIQEGHMLAYHIICELVEEKFGGVYKQHE